MPSIIVSSCLIGLYLSHPGFTSFLVCGHPLIIYLINTGSSASSSVAAFMSSIDMQIGISTVVLIVIMLMFIPDFSWCLFSAWLWWDYQSDKYNSGQGLNKIPTLYCSLHSIMHYNCCDNVTSLLPWPPMVYCQ